MRLFLGAGGAGEVPRWGRVLCDASVSAMALEATARVSPSNLLAGNKGMYVGIITHGLYSLFPASKTRWFRDIL